jgi:hypothetical protein
LHAAGLAEHLVHLAHFTGTHLLTRAAAVPT